MPDPKPSLEIPKIEITSPEPEESPASELGVNSEESKPNFLVENQDSSEKPKIKSKKKKIFFASFLILIIILGVVGVIVGMPLLNVVNKAKAVYRQGMLLKETAKSKDLNLISKQLQVTKNELISLKSALESFSSYKALPLVGSYQTDAIHLINAAEAGFEAGDLVIESMKPYADMIGFSGGQAGVGEKTAKDRITFITTTIEKIGPDMDKIGAKIEIAKNELDNINPKRYPVEFKGTKVRGLLTELITLVDQASSLTNDAKPVIQVAPWLMGMDGARRYLVVFQNDAEIRSTGGFMTAYAIIEVNKGKLTPILSENIYDLDARFPSKEKAPQALITYLPIPYQKDPHWRLRDMNTSPDFKVSMEKFAENFKRASTQKFDGIIAVDTQVLVKLLKVLGQIGVPGWGNFSAEPDKRCWGCPLVVYELERLADLPTNKIVVDRKAVIGPLMHSVLSNAFQSPKEKLPGLFDAAYTSIMEKHALFYFPDEKVQLAMESFNLAGRIRDYDGDYFMLVDSSFSGAKSNLFIKQIVEQKIDVSSDGSVTKTVTITYKNTAPASNCNLEKGGLCLNADYKNWFRVYVPKGSQLIESEGSDIEIKTYDELGKTVFDGFFGNKYILRPEGQTRLVLKYKLPFNFTQNSYRFLVQKQPGTGSFEYTTIFNNKENIFNLDTDKELNLN